MKEKEGRNQAHNDALLHQLLAQNRNGPQDQVRPVIGRDYPDALRQRWFDLFQARFHPLDDAQRVLTGPHDDHAPDGLPLPVQLGDATALLRSQLHPGDVPDEDRGAAAIRADRHELDILD